MCQDFPTDYKVIFKDDPYNNSTKWNTQPNIDKKGSFQDIDKLLQFHNGSDESTKKNRDLR